ncbi:MAG TPA: hypothetical protein VLZ83_08670 [Edaphocola sp.]|nr:hypothetical protein [Edaphocola sp.]
MKKKVIFAVATGLFALATVFNMSVLQSNSAGDVSLESIAVMAQANGESSGNSATCYSTYQDGNFLQGSTNIFICGICTQTKAKNYSDSGICYF